MRKRNLSEDSYQKIKPRLHRRIGRELRLAGRVLDLGCGSCDLVRYLTRTYQQHVTGVDISDKSFPRHHDAPGRGRFRCIRSNAEHLNFAKDRSRDAVVSMWALHEMKHPNAILAEAHRVLRPGGELLVVDFPKGSLAQRLWDEKYYSPDQVKRMLLENGFDVTHAKLIERGQIMWITGYRPGAESA